MNKSDGMLQFERRTEEIAARQAAGQISAFAAWTEVSRALLELEPLFTDEEAATVADGLERLPFELIRQAKEAGVRFPKGKDPLEPN